MSSAEATFARLSILLRALPPGARVHFKLASENWLDQLKLVVACFKLGGEVMVIADPESRRVYAFFTDRAPEFLSAEETLFLGDFSVPVSEFFE